MSRIAVIGYAADPTTQHMLEAAAAVDAPLEFIELAAFYAQGSIRRESGRSFTIRLFKKTLNLADYTGVYVRLMPPRASNSAGVRIRNRISRFVALHESLVDLDVNLVNPPNSGWENGSKPLQTGLLASAGFLVPESLATDRLTDVEKFRSACGRMVFKSNSSVRSIVQDAGEVGSSRWSTLENCPVLFQRRIEGNDVRVHTVVDAVFAVRIASDQVDYRYAKARGGFATMEEIDVPHDIAQRCLEYARSRNLVVAGFDFKVDGSGRWYCLEMNPSPGFESYDHILDGLIARRLIRFLREGE